MAMEGGGGGTLSELYQRSKRLLLTTRDGLERLERLEFSTSKGGVDSPELSFAVKRDIGQIQLLCVEMDRFWRSIAAKSQRDLWKRKVEQVAEEAGSLKESLDMYLSRNQRRTQEARERAELLGRVRAQRKALDVLNTVGVSNFVLRLIERRHRVDRLIKYVVLFTLYLPVLLEDYLRCEINLKTNPWISGGIS
ncbi:hypothetical protein C3L33_05962, partial [Rhododendron williamsianum]